MENKLQLGSSPRLSGCWENGRQTGADSNEAEVRGLPSAGSEQGGFRMGSGGLHLVSRALAPRCSPYSGSFFGLTPWPPRVVKCKFTEDALGTDRGDPCYGGR